MLVTVTAGEWWKIPIGLGLIGVVLSPGFLTAWLPTIEFIWVIIWYCFAANTALAIGSTIFVTAHIAQAIVGAMGIPNHP